MHSPTQNSGGSDRRFRLERLARRLAESGADFDRIYSTLWNIGASRQEIAGVFTALDEPVEG